jgi:hypothetical protein
MKVAGDAAVSWAAKDMIAAKKAKLNADLAITVVMRLMRSAGYSATAQ